jgi:hypothetical protein
MKSRREKANNTELIKDKAEKAKVKAKQRMLR